MRTATRMRMPQSPSSSGEAAAPRVSEQLGRWLDSEGEKTLSGLIALFGEKSFAVVFVLLLGVPALPLPTGGATHVLEIIAVLLAVQLIAGRRDIWLPERWRELNLAGERHQRFTRALLRLIRGLERVSKPRLRFLFHQRMTRVVFGVLVLCGTVGAFLAPPFSGLDTLPALGVVLLSLGVLLEDFAIVAVGVAVAAAGVALEVLLGHAALHAIWKL
jgi:hypothetical protein